MHKGRGYRAESQSIMILMDSSLDQLQKESRMETFIRQAIIGKPFPIGTLLQGVGLQVICWYKIQLPLFLPSLFDEEYKAGSRDLSDCAK